jgi:phage terminase large subunit
MVSADPESLFYEPPEGTYEVTRIGCFYHFLKEDSRNHRTVACWGGAGSGKSVSIIQELVDRFFDEDDIRIMMVRKTGPALTDTVFQMTIDEFDARGYIEGKDYRINRTSQTIWHKNNIMMYRSLDKESKKKSLNVNYVYVEESTEISFAEYLQLELRIRRNNTNGENQMMMSFNPTDPYHWTKLNILDVFNAGSKDIAVMHSTFEDNPFLPEAYKQKLRDLEGTDRAFFQIYARGEYAVITNVIYSNYAVEDKFVVGMMPDAYGIDFGFNVETAMVAIFKASDHEYYVREVLFKKKLTNADLIRFLKTEIPNHMRHIPIYADAAEPNRIQEINEAGFLCNPAQKAVVKGIDSVKSVKLHLHKDDINLLSEIRSYKWKEDKNGHVLDEPVKFHDHIMDSMRYAIYSSNFSLFGQDDYTPSDWKGSGLGKAIKEDIMSLRNPSNNGRLPSMGQTSCTPRPTCRGLPGGLFR